MEIETENSITKHFVLFVPSNIVKKFCKMGHIFIEFFQIVFTDFVHSREICSCKSG